MENGTAWPLDRTSFINSPRLLPCAGSIWVAWFFIQCERTLKGERVFFCWFDLWKYVTGILILNLIPSPTTNSPFSPSLLCPTRNPSEPAPSSLHFPIIARKISPASSNWAGRSPKTIHFLMHVLRPESQLCWDGVTLCCGARMECTQRYGNDLVF